MKSKYLYVIAGCNGAGKTTASFTVLPEILACKEFVNADEIAKGLSPFQPESVSFEAGRIMLGRINTLLLQNHNFSFETTLATKSYKEKILEAQQRGFQVVLLFFWLRSPELAIERVKLRVSEGGHNIPEEVIRRRYFRGIVNLFEKYIGVCDEWIVADNSELKYKIIAEGTKNESATIFDAEKWNRMHQLKELLGTKN
jgi:predicted ABC-type ATPase